MRNHLAVAVLASLTLHANADPDWVSMDQTASDWLSTVTHSRADILVLGDSVVLFGGHGWDDGINRALAESFGLAGSGLLHETSSGDGFRLITQFGWLTDINAAPVELHSYAVQSHVYTTGTGSQRRIGVLVESSSALAGHPLQLSAWGVSASGNDTLVGAARLSFAPYSTLYQSPVDSWGLPASGIDRIDFRIPGALTGSPTTLDYFINGSDDSSYVYLRALRPDVPGATVTSIGYGGQSVRDFHQNIWFGGTWDSSGRAAFLNGIVSEGSGKLLVTIFEGFNDRNETDPSLTQGITPGDSAPAFLDNIDTLIRDVQADWLAAGNALEDIGFVVFGMYDIQGDPDVELMNYRDALRGYAQGTPGVSFVDLEALGVNYDVAQPAGLFSDALHLSRAGTRFYSERLLNALSFAHCPGDIADDSGTLGADGIVSFGDFLALLGLVGPCDIGGLVCDGDIADDFGNPSPDGQVSFGDFLAMLGQVGLCQ